MHGNGGKILVFVFGVILKDLGLRYLFLRWFEWIQNYQNLHSSACMFIHRTSMHALSMHESKTVSHLCQVKQPFSAWGNYTFMIKESLINEHPMIVKERNILRSSLERLHWFTNLRALKKTFLRHYVSCNIKNEPLKK